MSDAVEKTKTGAILYDPAIINQISDWTFDASGWPRTSAVRGALRSAGRGNTMIVADRDSEFVLRHYLRGGLPGRLVRDSYLWLGEDRTRSFLEWRLLEKLRDLGLPVPRPVAARYCRRGPFYTADLMTERVPGIQSLADRLVGRPGDRDFWGRIGHGISRFHAAGVYHADLNAYNVQVDESGDLLLLDFDRGRITGPGVWQQKNLARLYRSLNKISRLDPRIRFSREGWNWLLEAYFNASRSA